MFSFGGPKMGVTFSISHPIGLACQRGHLEICTPCATRLSKRLSAGGGIIALEQREHCFGIYAVHKSGPETDCAARGSKGLSAEGNMIALEAQKTALICGRMVTL